MWRVLSFFLLAAALVEAQTNSDVTRWAYEAEHGDARAQFWLGAAYESGKGIDQNFVEALGWLMKSADQGNADAQYMLGQMYEEGEGVAPDYAQAATWYRAACENRPDYGGAGQGCNHLGELYLDARGVEQNRVQAYKYFKLGRNTENLAILMRKMTTTEIAEAEHETEQWRQMHPDR